MLDNERPQYVKLGNDYYTDRYLVRKADVNPITFTMNEDKYPEFRLRFAERLQRIYRK